MTHHCLPDGPSQSVLTFFALHLASSDDILSFAKSVASVFSPLRGTTNCLICETKESNKREPCLLSGRVYLQRFGVGGE